MFVQAPERMTLEEFLQWEQLQDEKHELIDGVPILRRLRKWPDGPATVFDDTSMMAGGSIEHGQIARNILRHLGNRLAGGPCQPLGSDVAVKIASGGTRYPDVHIHCRQYERGALIASEPVIVIEVLSPSNTVKQQLELIEDYQALPSVKQIVFVDQRRPYVFSSTRGEDRWERAELSVLDVELDLAAVSTELPLQDIYEGVFPPP